MEPKLVQQLLDALVAGGVTAQLVDNGNGTQTLYIGRSMHDVAVEFDIDGKLTVIKEDKKAVRVGDVKTPLQADSEAVPSAEG